MLEVINQNDRWITLSFGSWEKEVYKPFFYKRLNQLKQAKSLEELLAKLAQIEGTRAYSYLVYLLSRRAYTRGELRAKLEERAIHSTAIDEALDRLDHYLNDDDVILASLRKELRKGYGPRIAIPKVAMRLKTSTQMVSDQFETISYDEIEQAKERLLAKKKGKDERLILYQRGF